MTPMPPACAMAMAICASVTVSMAEAMIGMLTAIERVMRERISTSEGSTSDRPGLISTSSKVSAFARASVVFSGHRQLRLARKENKTGCRRLIKCLSRGGSSPDVTARFWVGAGG